MASFNTIPGKKDIPLWVRIAEIRGAVGMYNALIEFDDDLHNMAMCALNYIGEIVGIEQEQTDEADE